MVMYNKTAPAAAAKPSGSGVGDISLQIGSSIFRLVDLYAKTIYATRELKVYATPSGKKIVATIKAGEPIGTIRGYYPKGRNGAVNNFIIVGPNSKEIFFVPYSASNFSETKLKQQGTKTQQELVTDQEKENQPWYIKLSGQIVPWVAVGVLGYLFLKNGRK